MMFLSDGIRMSRLFRTFHVVVVQHLEDPERLLELLPAQEDVGVHVEVLRQGQILIDRLDAEPQSVHGGLDLGLLAHEEHLALVGTVDAGDHLDQRRLARSIVADQTDHLSRLHAHGDVVHRHQAAEGLGDVARLQQILHATPPCAPARG
jgi:hypothetical protein